ASADYFMQLRMRGKYRDLMSLIEFGDESYVITPFTTDYENILLSLRLVGGWEEWSKFADSGTIIAEGLNEAVELFRAFDFLDSAGNLIVIFSDGQDSTAQMGERTLYDVLQDDTNNKVPVYFVRSSFNRGMGGIVADEMWRDA